MKIAMSSGHGLHVRGASGAPVPPQIDEVDEARKLTETIADKLRDRGVTVHTFHDNTSHDQSTNLSTITNWHNAQARDLDISVHFNAYDGTAHGTEVLWVTQERLAAAVSSAIADAGAFHDRGAKYRDDLAFLNNTEEPAILLEICFCDHAADCNRFYQNSDAIAEAIADAVVPDDEVEVPPPEQPEAPEAPDDIALFPDNQRNITCTVFGGADDPNNSAYDEHFITDTELGCALPYKWRDRPPPQVVVVNTANRRRVTCQIVDVGPWNTDDPYWQTNTRPQAESGVDMTGRETNLAGIDLTPGAAEAIGLEGKGMVNWRFTEEPEGMV